VHLLKSFLIRCLDSSPYQYRRTAPKSQPSSVAQILNLSESEELPADSEHIYLPNNSLDQTFAEDSSAQRYNKISIFLNANRDLTNRSSKKNKITKASVKDFKILALQTAYKKTPDSPKFGVPDVEEEEELDLRIDLSNLSRPDTPKQFSKPPVPSHRAAVEDNAPPLWTSEPKESSTDYNKILQVILGNQYDLHCVGD
jgi:hypothetical protein